MIAAKEENLVGLRRLHYAAFLGLIGTFLLGFAACNTSYSHNPAGWPWEPMQAFGAIMPRSVSNWIALLGALSLVLAWWMLRPGANRTRPPAVALLALWSAPLLIVPPVLTADPFAYSDLGWILRQGGNPYNVGLASLGGPYAPSVDPSWANTGSPYPPLSLLAGRLGIEVVALHPYWGTIGQRLLALIGVGLVVALLPKLAKFVGGSEQWAEWLGTLNPLLVVHFVGGAHNDALMVGVVVLALWVATLPIGRVLAGLVVAPALIGLAMGLKQQAGLVVVAAAGIPVLHELRCLGARKPVFVLGLRSVIAAGVALLTLAAVSVVSGLGFGWVGWLSVAHGSETFAPSYLIPNLVSNLLKLLGQDGTWLYPVLRSVVVGACTAGLGWLLLKRAGNPMAIAAGGSLLVVLALQALRPWYLILPLVLFAAMRISERCARMLVWLVVASFLGDAIRETFGIHVLLAGTLGMVFAAALLLRRRAGATGRTHVPF